MIRTWVHELGFSILWKTKVTDDEALNVKYLYLCNPATSKYRAVLHKLFAINTNKASRWRSTSVTMTYNKGHDNNVKDTRTAGLWDLSPFMRVIRGESTPPRVSVYIYTHTLKDDGLASEVYEPCCFSWQCHVIVTAGGNLILCCCVPHFLLYALFGIVFRALLLLIPLCVLTVHSFFFRL